MNNKKCKTNTSVADLIKPKKMSSEPPVTSISDLIKPPKKREASETSETFVTDLIKPIKPKKKRLYETSETSTSVTDLIKPLKKKYLYTCNCLRCNGEEVDYRTQEKHTKDKNL